MSSLAVKSAEQLQHYESDRLPEGIHKACVLQSDERVQSVLFFANSDKAAKQLQSRINAGMSFLLNNSDGIAKKYYGEGKTVSLKLFEIRDPNQSMRSYGIQEENPVECTVNPAGVDAVQNHYSNYRCENPSLGEYVRHAHDVLPGLNMTAQKVLEAMVKTNQLTVPQDQQTHSTGTVTVYNLGLGQEKKV